MHYIPDLIIQDFFFILVVILVDQMRHIDRLNVSNDTFRSAVATRLQPRGPEETFDTTLRLLPSTPTPSGLRPAADVTPCG